MTIFPSITEGNPLKALLEDESISEIMVNGSQRIFVEQAGLLKKTPFKFSSDQELIAFMQSIAKYVGKTLDLRTAPYMDARLPDGSRVNCVLNPLSVDGPSLTIRKFSQKPYTPQQLLLSGTWDEKVAYFLNCCVAARINLLVSGGTGSGKTTLLNVLSSFIPPHERIICIEDASELKIKNENLVRLEARPGDQTLSSIDIRHLVTNALRMRPDRILVGECRGAEAFDMLSAMNTGHEGSMSTLHANSARDALRRLESMILMAGFEMPIKIIRQNMAGSLQLIVQIQRFPDGKRRVSEVVEVCGMESDVILTQDIFRYQNSTNSFHSSGFVPRFVKLFKEKGIDFPADFFTDTYTIQTKK